MFTLGIETSCDETSCAVLQDGEKILSNVISSSLLKHKKFGGVVPEIASRHCLEQIEKVYKKALSIAKIKEKDLGLIAVTKGPGLIGSLLVGISFAKAISYRLRVPMIGVNHLEAHIASNFIGKTEPNSYIGLIVSGGHTMITYHKKGLKTKVIGETVDDAIGEAYDKTAKILGLGYPGGPILDKLARKGNPRALSFTKPKQKNRFNFSFSGIKTAVLYSVKDFKTGKRKQNAPKAKDIAASFQYAVVGWLVDKTLDACDFKKVSNIAVGGGVSANSYLREKLKFEANKRNIRVYFPSLELTADNGAMIAREGWNLFKKGKRSSLKMTGNPGLTINK